MGKMTLRNIQTFLEMAGSHILTSNSGMNDRDAQELVTAAQRDLIENSVNKRFYLTV